MTSALPPPGGTTVFTQWSLQPLALLLIAGLGVWYLVGVRRLAARGVRWPAGRSALFGLGLVLLLWTTNGFAQAYGSSLFWVWTSQALGLLLVLPLILLVGRPLQLAQALGSRGVERFLRSGVARTLGNPLVGPALVPLLSAALFFGPVPAWAIRWAAVGWVLQLVVLALGGLIVLPLVGLDDQASSLAVGLSLAVGAFELVLDAIPGIVLRLQTHLATSYFDYRVPHSWSPSPLRDQQLGGAVLWCAAEVIDLPFLLLVFRRWIQADARDAAEVDAVLEAERASRAEVEDPSGPADAPWWLSDPAMRRRMGGPR